MLTVSTSRLTTIAIIKPSLEGTGVTAFRGMDL